MDTLYRPYAPARTVAALLRQLCRAKLPETLDREYLQARGLSAAIASRVSNTLRFLGLVDQYYEPRHDLQALVQSSDAEFPRLLERLLRRAYPDIFQNAHPSRRAQSEIIAAFRRYEPASQHYRMAILFLGLCREAGIPIQEQLRMPASGRGTQPSRDRAVDDRKGRSRATAPATKSRLLWETFARLPKPGGAFSVKEQDAWLEAMRNALRLEYRDDEETGADNVQD